VKPRATRLLICSCTVKEAGSYLKLFCSEDKKKEAQNHGDKELLELAVTTGMSLINLFLVEELKLHAELLSSGKAIGDGGVELISEQTLEMLLNEIIEVMQPDKHKNKENRKYNNFFKHAAEASGKVLQCLHNRSLLLRKCESGIQGATKHEKKLLVKKMQAIDKESQSDQLVTACGGICRGYTRAGKYLYTYAKRHLKMSGKDLNCVQDVLIAYCACLLEEREAAMDDEAKNACEQYGKDFVKDLLPNLASWLCGLDPCTQMLTLQLLTGITIYVSSCYYMCVLILLYMCCFFCGPTPGRRSSRCNC
jgi:hypothetical protein